jgi:hypothetical protein
MSVSVDTVYQRVLGILNKEQRGYVTPQEFNLFANQAQLDLFEQYFYDINQFGRMPGNSTEYSDMLTLLNEKINLFETTAVMAYSNPLTSFLLPADLYRLGTIIYTNTTTNSFSVVSTEDIEAERVNANEFLYINSSPLTKPKNVRPIYVANAAGIKVYGDTTLITGVKCNYIKEPAKVEWKYQMVYGEALYDSTYSVDFDLHPSEETELVIKVLEMAGLVVKDIQLYQIAAGEEVKNTQEEKS